MNMNKNDRCECCDIPNHKIKIRTKSEKNRLMNRLKRIEGQIRGIQRLLEEDSYCTDIMLQVSATRSALSSFNKKLLENHLNSCVLEDIRVGNNEKLSELIDLLNKIS